MNKLILIGVVWFFLTSTVFSKVLPFTRDPFMPIDPGDIAQFVLYSQNLTVSASIEENEGPISYVLNGIIWEGPRSVAMVSYSGGRQVVRISDYLGAYRVIDITKESIKLKRGQKQFILTIGKEVLL